MTDSDNILDVHGMLTENGRRIIRIALHDSNTAHEIFSSLRDGVNDKIRTCENNLRGFQKLVTEQIPKEKSQRYVLRSTQFFNAKSRWRLQRYWSIIRY